MNIETYIVDSFTDTPFKGNPAGVCILKSSLSDEQMLLIAQELGLSETAFIQKSFTENSFTIRYFSPKMEIPLCGHATLASSKVLFNSNKKLDTLHFKTIQNLDLTIKQDRESIVMEFPAYNTIPQVAPTALLDALGIKSIVNSAYNVEMKILLLEIEDSDILRTLTPDFEQLKGSHDTINGVVVTAVSSSANVDFESRYFWPWSGTNEDPVTGGTHTFLTKYWSKRLQKTKMNAFQCSERTGFMQVALIDDHRMTIKSTAQLILKGEITI